MKWIFSSLFFFAAPAVFACVDISGTYSMNGFLTVRYDQRACESLTQTYCKSSSECSGSSHTWLLDGVIRQEGGNPTNWAGIKAEGNTLKRKQLWASGTMHEGLSCEWSELTYSLDADRNLNVNFQLKCLNGKGKYENKSHTEVWTRI